MEDSQPSLSRERIDLDHAGNSTTTTIPFDLVIEILSRLPAKSLLRFQSVSKLWFSTIRSKNFVDSFLTWSKTRPRLLLMSYLLKNLQKINFIFSAPEHTDNKDDDKSSTVMARYDMPILEPSDYLISGSVNGFVCFRGQVCNTITVYNPITRQAVKLPEVTPNGRCMHASLGYDPVKDQYKVLCVTMRSDSIRKYNQQEHFVCTVSSSQKQEWRKIENPTGDNYSYVCGETCIDGALYYGAGLSRIVRFDVRSEKIDFIKIPKLESYMFSTAYRSIFINYKGKLARIDCSFPENFMTLWVFEDAEKQEWSSMTCVLPSQWKYLTASHLMSEGVIRTGELVVFSVLLDSSKPFYVCYYDFNKKIIRKVEILGMKDGDFRGIHGTSWMSCFPGHIENIRFL
ncbi:PREDICTED: F-box protein At1g30790-like [Brassica oleracea var. oleracea]|uniref:F-box domain-containing protein n=1 Tax=Brassica oleracea var. oleracea TaxID=109376 RepID=A0A0D3B284_BRAOL|nr:PREDICTED: F-box protein At1g30790-like [Brassica oleracea var. oleracea]